jgi:putative addiction module component (TIGR02574 family)
MSSTGEALLAAALKLPEAERAALAEALFESLDAEEADLIDDEAYAEYRRRLEECREDPSASVPWSELRDEG